MRLALLCPDLRDIGGLLGRQFQRSEVKLQTHTHAVVWLRRWPVLDSSKRYANWKR